ncbi:MAG: monovalent cation/H(+) antiporter subunit G [Longimicrobiales bacterium]|nr:monovalent cation/H(+) antiporter subunit G [Longimicrobiales bacterium]
MELILDVLTWIFVLGGGFFAVTGGIGVLRLPDVYTRLHASGMTDTMGAALILTGLMFQSGISLVTAKLVLILFFLWFTSPVATHAVARAALHVGIRPVRGPERGTPGPAASTGQED